MLLNPVLEQKKSDFLLLSQIVCEDVSEQCLQSKNKQQCQTLTTTIKNISSNTSVFVGKTISEICLWPHFHFHESLFSPR